MKPRIFKSAGRWYLRWPGGMLSFETWGEAVQCSTMVYFEYVPIERRSIVARILFRLYAIECTTARN
jgi:hypothetical protein